jgi:hypothetical protein
MCVVVDDQKAQPVEIDTDHANAGVAHLHTVKTQRFVVNAGCLSERPAGSTNAGYLLQLRKTPKLMGSWS